MFIIFKFNQVLLGNVHSFYYSRSIQYVIERLSNSKHVHGSSQCHTCHTRSSTDSKNTAGTNTSGKETSRDHESSIIVTRPDDMSAHIKPSMFGCALMHVFPHFLIPPSIVLFFHCIKVLIGCILHCATLL